MSMPPTALRPRKEYGLRIGTYEGDKGISLWLPQTDEAICVVVNGGITLNERSVTTTDGEFDINDIEIVDIDGSCCLITAEDRILHTFDRIDGIQILDFLDMNVVDLEIGFVELNGEPHISSFTSRNTVPRLESTKIVHLTIRSSISYHKKTDIPAYFSLDNVIQFPVDKCVLEKRDGTIFLMGQSVESRYVLFTVGTVSATDLNIMG